MYSFMWCCYISGFCNGCVTKRILLLQAFHSHENQYYADYDKKILHFLLIYSFIMEKLYVLWCSRCKIHRFVATPFYVLYWTPIPIARQWWGTFLPVRLRVVAACAFSLTTRQPLYPSTAFQPTWAEITTWTSPLHSPRVSVSLAKRYCLSWLTNSALVYEPKCRGGGGGCVAGSQPMSTVVHMKPKWTLEIYLHI